jgi:23S rRNA (adenine2030-N6)-methyltransferase
MNYRHAFHAGNFGDVMKHAVLVLLLEHLRRKPAPFFVLDTHAGPGRCDLNSPEARRTNEAAGGILRLLDRIPPPLERYSSLVTALGLYPGSPSIIRALLRPTDQLVCCELHPEDYAALHRLFGRDRQVAVHRRDGYEALGALLPLPQGRGLVLIDPPFEAPDEYDMLARGLTTAHRRFRQAMLAAWYPIKHRTPVRAFHEAVQSSHIRDVVAAELCLHEPLDPTRLNGAGLLIVNPPYRLKESVAPILQALLDRLGQGDPRQAASFCRLVDE